MLELFPIVFVRTPEGLALRCKVCGQKLFFKEGENYFICVNCNTKYEGVE